MLFGLEALARRVGYLATAALGGAVLMLAHAVSVAALNRQRISRGACTQPGTWWPGHRRQARMDRATRTAGRRQRVPTAVAPAHAMNSGGVTIHRHRLGARRQHTTLHRAE
ncbi:hypothetical protein GCM10023094_03690 [Rhodococcus olei]|uniref:Uncharacterized protein n=1 Tax=Rhodococcus olei TaxID=2161675 RepID=A0ABP8NV63_9NOCA